MMHQDLVRTSFYCGGDNIRAIFLTINNSNLICRLNPQNTDLYILYSQDIKFKIFFFKVIGLNAGVLLFYTPEKCFICYSKWLFGVSLCKRRTLQ